MNAHPRRLLIELNGFLVMDMEDQYNPSFCKTEADAKDVYARWPPDKEGNASPLRVWRMADGSYHDVTPDFIPDEVEADERPVNHMAYMRHIGAVERV